MAGPYKVKFFNPKSRKGFIDGFTSAEAAKATVRAYNSLYGAYVFICNEENAGLMAKYLGRESHET